MTHASIPTNSVTDQTDQYEIGPFLRGHWQLLLAEGIILMALGVAAILVPVFASMATVILLGCLLLIGGFASLVTCLIGRHAPGPLWSLISAAVTTTSGTLLLGAPLSGALSVTLVLTAFLLVDGVLMIGFGIAHRNQLSRRWGWLVANGLLDLLLAATIFLVLPGGSVWVLGLIVGIDMIFAGSSLIAVSLAARLGKLAADVRPSRGEEIS